MISDYFKEYPGQVIICAITTVGFLAAVILLVSAWRDWRCVRKDNGEAAFTARQVLYSEMVHTALSLVLLLLSVRVLVSAVMLINALPKPSRSLALAKSKHLSTAQIEAVALYAALVLLIFADSVRGFIGRRLFAKRYSKKGP